MAKKTRKGQKAKPWTVKDKEILIENVKKNVTNLQKAFNQTSKEIQRTPGACAGH